MARRRTHATAPRSRTVTIRLTNDEYLRRTIDARKAGLSVSGLCEKLICEGRVEAGPASGYRPMDPALFAELRRIGNNLNQVAHAVNTGLPPDVNFAWRSTNDLVHVLMREEMLAQQIATLRMRTTANDSPPPQTRDVFQRSVQLHPARRGQDFE
jgi:hypothetical protein